MNVFLCEYINADIILTRMQSTVVIARKVASDEAISSYSPFYSKIYWYSVGYNQHFMDRLVKGVGSATLF